MVSRLKGGSVSGGILRVRGDVNNVELPDLRLKLDVDVVGETRYAYSGSYDSATSS